MHRKIARAAAALALAALTGAALWSPAVAAAGVASSPEIQQEEPGRRCAPEDKPKGLRPGDTVEDCGVVVKVQPRGKGIWEEHFLANGQMEELTVETAEDGSVTISDWGSESDEPQTFTSGGTGGPAACLDTEYDLKPWTWETTYFWEFYSASRPDELSLLESETISTLRNATQNITWANNDCERGDNVSASANYDGVTSLSTTLCLGGSRDGVNTVRFSNISDPETLAVACTRYGTTGRAEESDVAIDKDNHEWYVAWSSEGACQLSTNSEGWSLEAVMTHERGHNFGLAHDYELAKSNGGEENHGYLTMSPKINGQCQNSESTLGLGDMLGLEQKY